MGVCLNKDCQRDDDDNDNSIFASTVDTKKVYSDIMKQFAPSKILTEKRFSLPENVDDFLFVPELKAIVVFTGMWLKSEFNIKISVVPGHETVVSPFNAGNISQFSLNQSQQFKLSNIGDSSSLSGPSFFSELPLDANSQPGILIYSIKRLKLISRLNKFSFGFSFYSRVRYSSYLSGFLMLEVNLGIYFLSIAGRKLSKILLSHDKDIDTRTFEVLDSFGYLAVSTKGANAIKLFALSNGDTKKSTRSGIPMIYINRLHIINLPGSRHGFSPITSISFTPKHGILIVSLKNRNYLCFRWDPESLEFETVSLHQYNQLGKIKNFEVNGINSYQRNVSFLMGNRKAWAFEDNNCLYLWRFDAIPSEVYIWETSLVQQRKLRLATKIDWSKFCELPGKHSWNFISEAIRQAALVNDNDTRALSLLALTFIKMEKGMISYDFVANRDNRLSLITLGVTNGRVYCQMTCL